MQALKWKWIVAICAALLLTGWTVISNLQRRYDVEFVVPDGFHGIFVIKEDRKNGIPPEWTDNSVRYIIPKSGVLITTDTSPLDVWHSESAKYSSGRQIPDPAGVPRKRHILIQLTYDSLGRNTFLIGSKSEELQYWKDKTIWFRIEPDTSGATGAASALPESS